MGVVKVTKGRVVEITRPDNRDISVSNTRGARGLVGPQGPPGPQGIQGEPPPTFIFDQGVASDEWIVNHDLDKYPSVTVVDSANSVVIGDVLFVSNSQIIIEFDSPFAGKAFLN